MSFAPLAQFLSLLLCCGQFGWHWPFAAIALVPLGIGLLIGFGVGQTDEFFCGEDFAPAAEASPDAVCVVQGVLIYYGALSGALWALFAVVAVGKLVFGVELFAAFFLFDSKGSSLFDLN